MNHARKIKKKEPYIILLLIHNDEEVTEALFCVIFFNIYFKRSRTRRRQSQTFFSYMKEFVFKCEPDARTWFLQKWKKNLLFMLDGKFSVILWDWICLFIGLETGVLVFIINSCQLSVKKYVVNRTWRKKLRDTIEKLLLPPLILRPPGM